MAGNSEQGNGGGEASMAAQEHMDRGLGKQPLVDGGGAGGRGVIDLSWNLHMLCFVC